MDSKNPDVENKAIAQANADGPTNISTIRNKKVIKQTYNEKDSSLNDFYTSYDPLSVSVLDRDEYQKYVNTLSEEELSILRTGNNYYEISCKNTGGLVMPIILEFEYKDGSTEVHHIPAEIWRMEPHESVSKVFITNKEVAQITLDPFLETADVDRANNYFPAKQEISRFELYKRNNGSRENPMQRDQRAKKKGKK